MREISFEQWARDMAAFGEAVAAVLRYEGETLHHAITRGVENASSTFADAFRTDRGQTDER